MKHRQYSVVIHNVDPEKAQAIIDKYVQEAKKYVMSIEPNPQGNGHHLHLFIAYRNQRSFKSVLRELEKLSGHLTLPRPEGETRCWGRVQLDVMRGTFEDCVAYLQGETKEKPLGDVKSGQKYPGELIQKMIALTYWQWLEGIYDQQPVMIQEFDEKYGERFCEACYEKWHDYIWDRQNPK